ncbi:MAG TPA: endonuclease [Bacteroidales bacterium]|mgnify:CR=1 FL=1|nr:endonuclease [Bacteroidales bacterium]
MISRLVFATLFFLACFVQAQPPPGYYSSATGLYGVSLQQALHQIIDNHYAAQYSALHGHFMSTDTKADSTVWDMYSDVPGGTPPYVYHFIPQDQCGNYSQEGDCYNREHSFPKSWFGGDVMPMFSDLFHLYPTDGFVNGQRGNLPYGVVQNANWTSLNGSKRGSSAVPGYTGTVFEPIQEYKGDFARTMFYMAVRYYGQDGSWPGSDMTNGAQPKPWALAMLRQWHQQDPVSQKEIDRNNAVYAIQNNRNPFIDHPAFVEDIWSPTAGIRDAIALVACLYPVPAMDYCIVNFTQPLSTDLYWQMNNTLGVPVNKGGLEPGQTLSRIDVTGLVPGMYFLQIHHHPGTPMGVYPLLVAR